MCLNENKKRSKNSIEIRALEKTFNLKFLTLKLENNHFRLAQHLQFGLIQLNDLSTTSGIKHSDEKKKLPSRVIAINIDVV